MELFIEDGNSVTETAGLLTEGRVETIESNLQSITELSQDLSKRMNSINNS